MFAVATGASLCMLSVAGGALLVVALLLCAHSRKSVKIQEPDVESDANENQEEASKKLIDAPSPPKTPNGNSPKTLDLSLSEVDRNSGISRQSKNQRSHTNVPTRQSAKKPEKTKDPAARRPMSEHVVSPSFASKLPMSTSERRLPAIPPPTGVPAIVNPPDFDQTYDFIPERGNSKDPNYQMIKDAMDPNYQRVNDADGAKSKRNPDYEIVKGENLVKNVENLKSDQATSEQSVVGEKKEDPYAKVKGDDPYAEVKNTDSNDKDYDGDYAEVKVVNDPYAKVESLTLNGPVEGAVAALVDVQEQKDYESVDETTVMNCPGNHSPRPVDHDNQSESRSAQPALPRVPPEVLPIDFPVAGPSNRTEPPYTQVSARESLESIRERKERERRQNPSVYTSVDEESSADYDQLYEQVESVLTTSELRPPALPPMSNRNSRVIAPSDVVIVPQQSCTLPVTGISLQQHYEEIGTEGLPQPPRQNTIPSPIPVESRDGAVMPVYAVVDKSKQKGGAKKSSQPQPDQQNATDFSYLYAKVEKNGKNKQKAGQGNSTSENPFAGTGARPKVKGHNSRDSTGSFEGIPVRETGYQSIEECKDGDDHSPNSSQNATHQSYQNKETMHLYEAVSEKDDKAPITMSTEPPRDMVHIESIKTPENFWRRKHHTYESMADDDDGETTKITASKSSPSLKTSVRQSDHMYEEVRLEANSRSSVMKIKSNTLNGDARDYRRQMEKEKSSKNNNKGEKKKGKKQGKEGKGKNKTDAKKQREKLKKHDYQNWPTRSPSM
ncbi:uncharacterized protein LOC117102791 [Anneissia japonica]|uniref:uncharacterized protein LOC117102791 n=1 Tax=Anneissia japonica TaxID=1529436 RepID=UPI001425B3D5|nr:uncharacterized protein LOC117102791 [Anneissia japonica]